MKQPKKQFDKGGIPGLFLDTEKGVYRLRYFLNKKERLLTLGALALPAARKAAQAARDQILAGVDPVAHRREVQAANSHTFGGMLDEYLRTRTNLADATKAKNTLFATKLRSLRPKPLASITAKDIASITKVLADGGQNETARRVQNLADRVFAYAIAAGRCESNPATQVRGVLPPVVVKNRAAIIDEARFGELLRALWGYRGKGSAALGLKLLILTATRSGELRGMRWGELDKERTTWRIPAERMKMREPHVVPLSEAAREVLKIADLLTTEKPDELVFPSFREDRPLSENAFASVLSSIGFDGAEVTPHGFRTSFSTILNERGHDAEVIELCLAHVDSSVRAVYNRGKKLAERRLLMDEWGRIVTALRG